MQHLSIIYALRTGITYCLYLVVFAPMIISAAYFFPAIFPKATYIFILTEIALVAYVPLLMLTDHYRPRYHLVYGSLAVFILVVLITSFAGINSHYSVWGNYERMDGIFAWAHYWVLIVIAASVLKEKREWLALFGVSLAPALIVAGYGFLQRAGVNTFGPFTIYGTGEGRITGPIGNPAFMAVYLLFNITFGLVMITEKSLAYGWKIYAALSVAVLFVAYIMTGVRGAFVGFVAGVAIFTIGYLFWGARKEYRKYVIAGAIGFVLVLGLLYGLRSQDWVRRNFGRFFDITLSDSTTQTRLISWRGGLKGFKESPLLGVGPQKFDVIFNKYFDPAFYTLVGSETWWDRAHNMIIEVLATMGIIGLAAYLGVGLSMLYALWNIGARNDAARTEVLLIVSFLAAYFIQNLFVFDTISSYIMLVVLVAYIISRSHESGHVCRFDERIRIFLRKVFFADHLPALASYWMIGFIAGALLVGPTAFAHNLRLIKHNKLFLEAIARANVQPREMTLNAYREITEVSDFDSKEVAIKLGQFAGQQALSGKMTLDELNSMYALVMRQMERAIEANPQDVRLMLSYGNTVNVYGELLAQNDPDQAKKILQKAEQLLLETVELGPSRQQVFYSLANTYLIGGQNDRGVRVLEDAVRLHDETPQAYWILAIAYVRSGRNQDAMRAAGAAIDRGYAFSQESEVGAVANAYVTEGNLAGLLKIYERMAETVASGTAQAKFAALLAQLGRKEEALDAAAEVLRLDSSLTAQVEDFIQKVQSGEKVDFL